MVANGFHTPADMKTGFLVPLFSGGVRIHRLAPTGRTHVDCRHPRLPIGGQ
jgi:hypothetical protein